MRAYHFIKYSDSTSLDNFIDQTENKTILCFDFEDSIQSCSNPTNTSKLKSNYRKCFKSILETSKLNLSEINIGIRINATDSDEYPNDLSALAGIKHISAIFLPKISSPEQILNLQNDLHRNAVNYNELIPVIETKSGMKSLEDIAMMNSTKIRRIAFGHCDYNFNNQHYPYFHQDSREYWTWIKRIIETIAPYKLGFVNSPFLQLDNDAYFTTMLSVLDSISGSKGEQITLTQKQTKLCNSFTRNDRTIIPAKIVNRFDLSVPRFYAEKFITSFEKNCRNKGFAISENRTILSPQEYLSSINYLKKADFPEYNFTFAGGCFPVQGNLCFENLFHQKLKREIENTRELKFNVNIIHYERFKNCIAKLSATTESKPVDLIVFSVRPEPYLRLVKLYYKFIDHSTKEKKWSFNLPFFKNINPEKHDLLALNSSFNPSVFIDSSTIHKTFTNINYILGALLGNNRFALRAYSKLITEVIEFGDSKRIELIILGPPIRTNTIVERFLSRKLDRFIRKFLIDTPVKFISGSDQFRNGENLFQKNGIYANEKYHELIAERLFEMILPSIDKKTKP